jgi:hypothetical protein
MKHADLERVVRFKTWEPPPADHAKIADRWKAQYKRGRVWTYCGDKRGSRRIHTELVALGANPSPADIDEIIGNDSWTR